MSVVIERKELLREESRRQVAERLMECMSEIAASTAEAYRIDIEPVTLRSLYGVGEVAQAFQVSERMVRKWCESGRVVALKTPGGSWRIPSSQFADLDKVKAFQETTQRINSRFAGLPEIDDFEK